jgi:cytochrome c oxidase subunit II
MTRWLLCSGLAGAVLLAAGGGVPGSPDAGGPQERVRPQESQPREIEVRLERFEFVPERIEVAQGERVRILASSADVPHGFGIEALGIDEEIARGETVSIDFVAEEPGAFEIACTEYCGIGHDRMKGLLLVRPQTTGAR